MPTISLTGTNLGRFGASWNGDGEASQGAYYSFNSGKSQRGRATFSTLPTFNFSKYYITKVKLTMTFTSAGASRKKTMCCYFSNSSSSYKVSPQQTAGTARNATTYITWTSQADIDIITNSIKAGNTYISFYNGETKTGSGYSTNYCKMSKIVLEITYEEIPQATCKYYTNGAWIDCKMKVYTNGAWIEVKAKQYTNGGFG